MDYTSLNNNMIDGQVRPINGINEEIIDAFSSVDRANFVPQSHLLNAYIEKNLHLTQNRYLLRSNLIAEIINHVLPRNNETILVLPSSTGYSSAVISKLSETVISIEEDENLIAIAENGIRKSGIDNVVFLKKKITENCLEQGPFNAIIIEGAIDYLPNQFLEQLEENGRLFAMINDNEVTNAKLFKKVNKTIKSKFLFSCDIPKLNFFSQKSSFSF